MSFVQYFKDTILPQIIQSGGFGEFPKVVNLKDASEEKEEFMSCVKCLDVEIKVGDCLKIISVFCKFENESTKEKKREIFQTDLQFSNEVLVYKELISSYPSSISNLFPKFYFGLASAKSPERCMIVLENLISSGYESPRGKLFLDIHHCSLAFQKLGEFHGASLQMKTKNPLKFHENVNQLFETKWMKNRKETQTYFYRETTRRGVIPLLANGENVDILNAFLERMDNVHNVIDEILAVNEKSVLCHGDFCSNNMVFKYSSLENNPEDVKFYDLGTARYASPVIDISFFLFLNTTSDLRRKYLKDLLQTYLDGVKKYAGPDAPSMEALWEEFQKKAVYGYLLVSFFLPIMWHEGRDPDTDDIEEITKQNLRKGGQEVTDMLSDIVRDLASWGCFGSSR